MFRISLQRCAQHDRGGSLKPLNEIIVQTHLRGHNVGSMHPRTVVRPPRRTPFKSSSTFHRMEPPGRERHRRVAREGERAGASESNALQRPHHANGFTLIELLVVIAIIAILIGLLFPAFKAVQNQARQTQAKNDLTQIVNAVNAYYTEYGKYPLGITADTTYGPTSNEILFTELRGCTAAAGSCPAAATTNARQIVFISPPDVKNSSNPRSGIGTTTGVGGNRGQYFDPWGNNYVVRIYGGYNNQVANPYGTNGAGADPLQQGVIAWSLGPDGCLGTKQSGGSCDGIFTNSDDVISWQ
jgi:prepilin-type N-terminal cleavage/methylation domain-containing protein